MRDAGGWFPSGAKAQGSFLDFMYGLKPVPFTLKPVPFTLKPVPFTLKLLAQNRLKNHSSPGPASAAAGNPTAKPHSIVRPRSAWNSLVANIAAGCGGSTA